MVNGWNLLTNEAAAKRKVREIRNDETDDARPARRCGQLLGPYAGGLAAREPILEEECPEGVVVDVVCIPTGFHLAEGTHWHPTGEVEVK